MGHKMTRSRTMRGQVAHLSGQAAEDIIEREYRHRGAHIQARRFRASSGEIDLVARDGDEVIFVEVKKAGDIASAAARLGRNQLRRIYAAASEYLAGEPQGQLTPVRFDVALVGATGTFEIIENAFGAV